MKQSQTCPKCAARRIWVIDPFRVPIEPPDGAMLPPLHLREGRELPLVVHQNPGGFMTRPVGKLAAYVCAGCGYSELYASDLQTLVEDPANGIRLLSGSPPPAGPFR